MSTLYLEKLHMLAASIGLDALGVTSITQVDETVQSVYEQWLEKGSHGKMSYLEHNRMLRYDPRKEDAIMEGAKSVIVVAASYFPRVQQPLDAPIISKYAYGDDYHKVLRNRIEILAEKITQSLGPHKYRVIVDTVPFLERYWAVQSGIGFIGRNHSLIIPKDGSYFFLGELITTHDFQTAPILHSSKPGLHCGHCKRCLMACPTGALTEDGFDARRCISYLTIEHKGEIASDLSDLFGCILYGCDICQDVCPYNHHPKVSRLFDVRGEIISIKDEDLKDFTREYYKRLVKDSALSRASYAQMCRNVQIYIKNKSRYLSMGQN